MQSIYSGDPTAQPTPLQDREISSQAIMAADKARAMLMLRSALAPSQTLAGVETSETEAPALTPPGREPTDSE
jgi:hypothetical protein